MRIEVRAPCRLHLGLLSAGDDARGGYGGAGLMIQDPAVHIALQSSDGKATVVGALGVPASVVARAERIVDNIYSAWSPAIDERPMVMIQECPLEHHGLGVGTQLSMAIGWALSQWLGKSMSLESVARVTGRGRRSGVGVHGFAHGGFLIDGGKGPSTSIAPLIARAEFPADWPILLLVPPASTGQHGAPEETALAQVRFPTAVTDHLCRLLLLEILPAIAERDIERFGHHMALYNRTVGECFASVQGGAFASSLISELVTFLAQQGIYSAQSSWGPTIFAFVPDEERGRAIAQEATTKFSLPEGSWQITRACNEGASIQVEEESSSP